MVREAGVRCGDGNIVEDEHVDEIVSTYVPPPQKSIGELLAADQEDESLRKYKEALLGNAVSESIVIGEEFSQAFEFMQINQVSLYCRA